MQEQPDPTIPADRSRAVFGGFDGESYADMLKRYGVATTVGAGRTPAQAEQKRK